MSACEGESGKSSNHALCGVIHDVSKTNMADGRNEKVSTPQFKKTTETIKFRWDRDDKIENLIRCLANYKSQMDCQNINFNGDKVKQIVQSHS